MPRTAPALTGRAPFGTGDPVVWNSGATAGAEKAWRDHNDTFDAWLPFR